MNETDKQKDIFILNVWRRVKKVLELIISDFLIFACLLLMLETVHKFLQYSSISAEHKEIIDKLHFWSVIFLLCFLAIFLIAEVVSFKLRELMKK